MYERIPCYGDTRRSADRVASFDVTYVDMTTAFQRQLRVLDIDDDLNVRLQGENGMCLPQVYKAPATVSSEDVRAALKAGRDVEAVVVGCASASSHATKGRIHVIRVHA